DIAPRFNLDGTRVWYTQSGYSGSSAYTELRSIRLDGEDDKASLRLGNANEIVMSPDESMVAYSHFNDLWIMPVPWTMGGTPTFVDAWQGGQMFGMIKISARGGYFPSWIGNSEISWTYAGAMYRRGIKADDKPVESPIKLTVPAPIAQG